MSEKTVVLNKPTVNTKLGLRLEDRKPEGVVKIITIAANSPGATCKQLKKGDVLLAVNGHSVNSHKRAAEELANAQGDVTLLIRRDSSSRSFLGSFRSTSKLSTSSAKVPAAPSLTTSAAPATATMADHAAPIADQPPPASAPVSAPVDPPEKEKPAASQADEEAAAVRLQAASRGNLARKHTSQGAPRLEPAPAAERALDSTSADEVHAVFTEPTSAISGPEAECAALAPAMDTKREHLSSSGPTKKQSKGGFLGWGKLTREEVAWNGTYEVTLIRGPETFKVIEGQQIPVKASLGMKIVQFSVDAPPVIAEVYPGQPAARSGVVQHGDVILSVNGIDMMDPSEGITALAEVCLPCIDNMPRAPVGRKVGARMASHDGNDPRSWSMRCC